MTMCKGLNTVLNQIRVGTSFFLNFKAVEEMKTLRKVCCHVVNR